MNPSVLQLAFAFHLIIPFVMTHYSDHQNFSGRRICGPQRLHRVGTDASNNYAMRPVRSMTTLQFQHMALAFEILAHVQQACFLKELKALRVDLPLGCTRWLQI